MTSAAVTVSMLQTAKVEYVGLFDALAGDTTIVIVSVSAIFLVFIVFSLARMYTAYLLADDARAVAEGEAERAREQNLKL